MGVKFRAIWSGLVAALQLVAVAAHAQPGQQREASATELPAVTVTAPEVGLTSGAIEADREEVELTPGGVTLVDGGILDERNSSSMADMLRYVPGLFLTSDNGGQGVFLTSRGSNLDTTGFDESGMMILVNGLPVTTADGNNHNRFVDPLSTRYAIVARGANAMKYGASTLGGAINFISPTAYDMPGVVLRVSGGSFGQVGARATVSKVFGNGLDGLVTLTTESRDGYREHNQSDQVGLYGNAGWRISDIFGTRLYLVYVDSDRELPGGLTRQQFQQDPEQGGTDALIGNFQKDVKTLRFASKSTWQPDARRRLDFGLSYEEQSLFHPIVRDFDPATDGGFDGLAIDTDHQDIGAMVRYEHQLSTHDIVFGANYRVGEVEGKNFGNRDGEPTQLQTLVDKEADTLQAYLVDRWHIGARTTLVSGLQYVNAGREIHDAFVFSQGPVVAPGEPDDTVASYSSVNPRLGIIYHVEPQVSLFANVSRTYEPPTNFKLTDDVSGDDLQAMEGTVVELGLRGTTEFGRASRWGWELSIYYGMLSNEILSVENPAPTSNSDRFLTTNVDDTIHAGLEALFSAHFTLGGGALEPILSLTVNEFKFDSHPDFGDNAIPGAPTVLLKAEVLYRHGSGFYAGPTLDVVDDRFADYANSYVVDSYALLGFLTGWSNENLSVYLELENLFDQSYVTTHSVRNSAPETDDILHSGAPRSVFAGVEWRY